jgi:hypothetical protein
MSRIASLQRTAFEKHLANDETLYLPVLDQWISPKWNGKTHRELQELLGLVDLADIWKRVLQKIESKNDGSDPGLKASSKQSIQRRRA